MIASRLRGALSFHRFNNAPRGLANRVDRAANRLLVRTWPALARAGRRARATALRWERRLGRWLRPAARLLFRALARLERLLLRSRDRTVRIATWASTILTPERAICLTILAAAGCLGASQFVEGRAIEIGQPGYAGLPSASAPRVAVEAVGAAHAYLLVGVAALAAVLALAVLRTTLRRRADLSPSRRQIGPSAVRRQQGLGRVIFLLGLLSLAIALLVDLPAAGDVGEFSSRFAGASAVLLDGFYAQIAAAAGLMLGGLLLVLAPKAAARYHARPCRTRINSFARVASALRRRRRRRASSRGRATRRGSPPRSGAASAPASPR
jgi:hypothetical protein